MSHQNITIRKLASEENKANSSMVNELEIQEPERSKELAINNSPKGKIFVSQTSNDSNHKK